MFGTPSNPPRRRRDHGAARPPVGAVLLLAILSGCGADQRGGPESRGGTERPREVLVSAAASLADAFDEVATAFAAVHPEIAVTLNLAGSSALKAQILDGAPVDVFASADQETMQELMEAGEISGEGTTFATNRMVIVTPAGNPGAVAGLGDLARPELLVGLCAEPVPCGRLARAALAAAGVEPVLDSEEPDVRALLTKVVLDELDVGITYLTDAASAGEDVNAIEIPAEWNVTTSYPIGVLRSAEHPDEARAFVDFVLSPEGRAILARHGFGPP